VRDDPSDAGFLSFAPAALDKKTKHDTASLPSILRAIFGYRNTWLIFLAQGGFVGAVLSFTGLWGPPFLRVRFALQPTSAAAICSVMIVCWAAASPLFGFFSDQIGRRKPLYVGGAICATIGWTAMFYAPLPLAVFIVVAALTSFATGAVIIGFAYAKESVPILFLGTVSGTINAGNMIGPMLLQPGIGWLLDRQWSGQILNGARVYQVHDFQIAFLLVTAWTILTCILTSLTRETNCTQSREPSPNWPDSSLNRASFRK
jgi:MFS family permease